MVLHLLHEAYQRHRYTQARVSFSPLTLNSLVTPEALGSSTPLNRLTSPWRSVRLLNNKARISPPSLITRMALALESVDRVNLRIRGSRVGMDQGLVEDVFLVEVRCSP